MKQLILFGIFILFLVAMQFSGALTANEIIEKYLRARGGLNKAANILSIYMEGMITLLGVAALLKITKNKNELNPAGFNAEWQVINLQGNSGAENINSILAQEVMAAIQTEPELTDQLINYAEKGFTAVLIGKDFIDTIACYHLKLTHNYEPTNHYWISTGDFLLVQSSLKNNRSNTLQLETIKTNYTDYKIVNGQQIAHSLQIQITSLTETIPVKINFNTIIINQ